MADKAKKIYNAMPGAETVDVGAAFTPNAGSMRLNGLATSLANFVQRNHERVGSSFKRGLPDGYCHIGIFPPLNVDPTGRWHIAAGFNVKVAARQLLAERIGEKNQRLQEYRNSAGEMWLVIVNDRLLGHGEVYARPEDLAEWSFTFDFQRVLLFSRQPGGGGDVIEVRREGA